MKSAASTAVPAVQDPAVFLQEQEQWLRARLEEIKRKRGGAIQTFRAACGASSPDDMDQAAAGIAQEIAGALVNGAHADYEATLAALNKIVEREGNYGNCEECGESMTQRRLRAVRAARFCVPCQDRMESTMGIPSRRSRRG